MNSRIEKLGDVIQSFDYMRKPLSTLDRNKRAKIFPYYGANGIIDYVDDYIYDGNYLLMAEDGTVLTKNKYPVIFDVTGKFWVSNHAHVFKAKENIIDQKYLYYALRQTNITPKVTGAVQMKLSQKNMNDIEIPVPDMAIQRQISNILEKIDKKIECNNRTNDNLHEMCLLLYRELIDKTGGKKDLLKNHAKCILGGTPSRAKPEYWNGNINWINSSEINRFRILKPSETITKLGLKKTSTTPLPAGTTVLAITGATLGQVSRLEVESCANQSVIGVIPDKSLTNEYVYLDILENINHIIGRQTGGAQQHINKNDVETYEIMIPDAEELSIFETKVESLFGQIRNNCIENERLTKLRDTLLPELLNGKIDVSNIDI